MLFIIDYNIAAIFITLILPLFSLIVTDITIIFDNISHRLADITPLAPLR
jgi:hypothetical protein